MKYEGEKVLKRRALLLMLFVVLILAFAVLGGVR
jgi:hypothetical protein